jgi:serine-aspartate repeat-containing protein C/D/E
MRSAIKLGRRGAVVSFAAASLAAAMVLPAVADEDCNAALGSTANCAEDSFNNTDNSDNSDNSVDNSVEDSYNDEYEDSFNRLLAQRGISDANGRISSRLAQSSFVVNLGLASASTGGNSAVGVDERGDQNQEVGDQTNVQGASNSTSQNANSSADSAQLAEGDTGAIGIGGSASAISGGQSNGNLAGSEQDIESDGEAEADSEADSEAENDSDAESGDTTANAAALIGVANAAAGGNTTGVGSQTAGSGAGSEAGAANNSPASGAQSTRQNAQQENKDQAAAVAGNGSGQAVGHANSATTVSQGGSNDNATIQDQAALNEGSAQVRGGNSGRGTVVTGDATALNESTTIVDQKAELKNDVDQRISSRLSQRQSADD